MTRTFTDSEAKRERVPLLIGLVGPSGSGKTYSALELATGIQSVTGGEIYYIDTEAKRALHYADKFKFRHLPFTEPFGPLDYLSAIEHCVKKGAKVLVVDSMSYEHEGRGGVLEMHEAEMQRMAGDDWAKRQKVNMLAWAKPKAERRKLINALLQMDCNFVFAFRAKEKVQMKEGKQPLALGWMPIAGEEFIYEQTLNCLLLPSSNGFPTWNPAEPGEKQMIKLPEQFKGIFASNPRLTADLGAKLAIWATGGQAPGKNVTESPVEPVKAVQEASSQPVSQPAATQSPAKPASVPPDETGVQVAEGHVFAFTQKTGSTNDKPWTLTTVEIDGNKYGTFSTDIATTLAEAKAAAMRVSIKWAINKRGSREIKECAYAAFQEPPEMMKPTEEITF